MPQELWLKLLLSLILAFLAEGMTEYFFGPLFERLANWTGVPELGDLRYIAALVGVGLSFGYALDVLAALGFESVWPWLGQLLTGIMVGRGSNYMHDFIGMFVHLDPVADTTIDMRPGGDS